ncbi:hypothetical protein [Cyanobium sp. Morenito 9A2]|uniref:hypothetical protein n=1 Tax=Cyanobium sp. Morenito 9A2 TaxID=2823718 RepID=UPI0020CDACED|nr:hypothetical protein [Cyanobium sp. Morenito 9A2]MCP9849252.1 hypothetical protein [Cyanobium sp. Morenito 9A2]
MEEDWSHEEEEAARAAFTLAYERDLADLTRSVQELSNSIVTLDQIWGLHDYLSTRRYEFDGKYDFNTSALLFTFAGMVKDGLLQISDLEGLNIKKLAKITALSRM